MVDRLSILRAAQNFEARIDGVFSGEVRTRLMDRNKAEITVPNGRVEIAIERGFGDNDEDGWIIYPQHLQNWADDEPVTEDERVEIARVLTGALEALDYVVWR